MLRYNDAVIRSILRRKKRRYRDILNLYCSFYFYTFRSISFYLFAQESLVFLSTYFPSFILVYPFARTRRVASRFTHITPIDVRIANPCVVESRVQHQAKLRRNALLLLLALSWLVQRREVLIHTVDVFRYVTLNSHNLAR